MEAALRIHQGAIDANLGGGVIKQRIARKGQGRSSGSRAIVLLCLQGRMVYVYGFEKKDKDALAEDELSAFRELATVMQGYRDAELAKRVADGALIKVEDSGEDQHG